MEFLKSRKLDKSGYRRSGMTPAQLRGSATQSGVGYLTAGKIRTDDNFRIADNPDVGSSSALRCR